MTLNTKYQHSLQAEHKSALLFLPKTSLTTVFVHNINNLTPVVEQFMHLGSCLSHLVLDYFGTLNVGFHQLRQPIYVLFEVLKDTVTEGDNERQQWQLRDCILQNTYITGQVLTSMLS